jgi:hypothetical protein
MLQNQATVEEKAAHQNMLQKTVFKLGQRKLEVLHNPDGKPGGDEKSRGRVQIEPKTAQKTGRHG